MKKSSHKFAVTDRKQTGALLITNQKLQPNHYEFERDYCSKHLYSIRDLTLATSTTVCS